jgi:hypothetical protein
MSTRHFLNAQSLKKGSIGLVVDESRYEKIPPFLNGVIRRYEFSTCLPAGRFLKGKWRRGQSTNGFKYLKITELSRGFESRPGSRFLSEL